MNSKFATTSSSLFNNNNLEELPDWMKDINVSLKETKTYDLGIEAKGSFADKQTVYREENDSSPRELEASFNDTKLITDAKIQLARFLSGKYYKVTANAYGNSAKLDVKIDGIPAEFTFNFLAEAGKLNNENTFSVMYNGDSSEYPYSKAGFEECITDIKSNKITSSTKVDGVGKTYLINREEIIRRCNGQLREATDKINELLKSGDILGVGSNTYASFYDVDYLFPAMEKEAGEAPLPSFEFAPNTEHVAAKAYRSEQSLSIDASQMLSHLFQAFQIVTSRKDGDELLVKANILNSNGVRKIADFCFGIENAKIASLKFVESENERMTVEQLLSKFNLDNKVVDRYLQQHTATKKIYRGIVLTEREIKQRLGKLVSSDIIPQIIDNWCERALVTPVNSTTYTTTYTFEELLANTNTKLLSEAELENIKTFSKKFGEGLNVEREEVEDTGVREPEEYVSNETMLTKANEFLSKYFKNFVPSDFNSNNEVTNYSIQLFDEDTGLSTAINFSFYFDHNKIASCHANINGSKVEIDNIKKAFATNELLNKYLQNNDGKRVDAPMVMTVAQLKNKLASITNADLSEIEDTINQWENTGKINRFSSNAFGSKHTFEQLLSMSNIKPLNDNEAMERLSKSQRSRQLLLKNAYIQDSDTRELVEKWSSERMIIHAKSELNKIFKDYDILDASANNEKAYTITARVVNPFNGIRQKLNFTFAMVNDKPANILAVSNNEKTVGIDKIERLCVDDKALNLFVQSNSVNNRNYKNIITKAQLNSKLDTVINVANINDITDTLITSTILKPLDSNTFASDYSLSEIVAYLSKSNKTDLETAHDNKVNAKRDENKITISEKRVMGNDSRAIEAGERKLSPKMTELKDKIHATAEKANNQKIITSKKLVQINSMLDAAVEEKDLELAWKELKKYFN